MAGLLTSVGKKAAKKVAEGWDEAAWLTENPRPHPDIRPKDMSPSEAKDLQRHALRKSKAKKRAGQEGYDSTGKMLPKGSDPDFDEEAWLAENPRPEGKVKDNPEVKSWMNRRWEARNGVDVSAEKKEYALKNKEVIAERRRGYNEKNKGARNAQLARRRSAKIDRTPEYSNRDAIKDKYDQASLLSEATGIPHEVDHVIPLQGERVSGLHVPGNLMIVPQGLNRSKGADFTPGDDPMRLNDVAQKNISEQNARGLLEDGFADPRLLAGTAGTTAAILAAPMVKDSGMISAPRSETLFDLTMGARDLERRLEGSPASLLFPSGLVDYLETVNRREEDPNAMTRGMALLDVLPF
jgi:hypothetical protein